VLIVGERVIPPRDVFKRLDEAVADLWLYHVAEEIKATPEEARAIVIGIAKKEWEVTPVIHVSNIAEVVTEMGKTEHYARRVIGKLKRKGLIYQPETWRKTGVYIIERDTYYGAVKGLIKAVQHYEKIIEVAERKKQALMTLLGELEEIGVLEKQNKGERNEGYKNSRWMGARN